VRPDQCGFGRPFASLPPGDREVVEQYAKFLAGDLDYDPKTNEFVRPGTGISRMRPKTTPQGSQPKEMQ
jgi:hypothetical protein